MSYSRMGNKNALGNRHTKKTKKLISKCAKQQKRKPFTQHSKQKMSESRKQWWANKKQK